MKNHLIIEGVVQRHWSHNGTRHVRIRHRCDKRLTAFSVTLRLECDAPEFKEGDVLRFQAHIEEQDFGTTWGDLLQLQEGTEAPFCLNDVPIPHPVLVIVADQVRRLRGVKAWWLKRQLQR